MFDLNEKKFEGTVIFNNGKGGLVKDVNISVEKRKMEEPDTYPNYKLVVSDGVAKINQGFYYPKANANKTAEANAQGEAREVGRIVHIARAVLGQDYVLPKVESAKEAYDVLFELVNKNAEGKTFNVFATYGTTGYPSKFLGLRYFNFIESADSNPSRLRTGASDLLERLEQDAPAGESSGTKTENWV